MPPDINSNDDQVLEKLRAIALEQALSSRQLPDLEKAVSIVKTLTDRDKALSDSQSQPKILSFERYKTFATSVVPLLTLITLAVTVWIQGDQLAVSREANEDLAWRETAKNVLTQLRPITSQRSPSGNVVNPQDLRLAVQLLRPYLSDSRHGSEALDIALLVLIRTREPRILQDFMASPIVRITHDNLEAVLSKVRDTWAEFEHINNGLADKTIPLDSPIAINHGALLEDITVLNNKIGEFLRTRQTDGYALGLDRTFFYHCDLSRANLSGASLSEARFETVDLTGADVSDVRNVKGSSWVATNWWEAKAIAGELLQKLIHEYYPYQEPSVSYEKEPPDASEYRKKVTALCNTAGIVCKDSDLMYGTKPQPTNK